MILESTTFENAVLKKLLDGELDALVVLRQQLKYLSIRKREFTGYGVYVYFSMDNGIYTEEGYSFKLGDVVADINGIPDKVGAILYIENGKITMLECYSLEGCWPKAIDSYSLHYMSGDDRDWDKVRKMIDN